MPQAVTWWRYGVLFPDDVECIGGLSECLTRWLLRTEPEMTRAGRGAEFLTPVSVLPTALRQYAEPHQ